MTLARKILAWFSCGLLAVSLASGCGGANSSEAEDANQSQSEPPKTSPTQSAQVSKQPPSVDGKKSDNKSALSGTPVSAAPEPTPREMLADGWIALFDGETLFGWNKNSDANWAVESGAITVSAGEAGLLTTALPFANYQLRLEFQADEKTNSGIFLRTPIKPTSPAKDCYELNIAPPDNPFPTGSLVSRSKVEGVEWTKQWRAYDVTVDGAKVVIKLDGETLLEYDDPDSLKKGFIGLQLNQGRVAFRNILLRPLGLQSIFNGKNLDGWTSPESPAEFTVTSGGEMNVKNGRGQLESKEHYADFVLQLECISHAANLNSGLFFRCVPGSTMDGYESQIHNGFKNGDRRAPIDHGTGGIFRRQPARLVVADDLDWFYKTIIADGDTMGVWVNGYQVSNWTDPREPNENPRKGLRKEKGSLMIQGHDPTTNLSFRNFRISEQ